MNLLLDTHVLLRSLTLPDRLRQTHRAAIEAVGNEVWVSTMSIWEIVVNTQIGKLTAPEDLAGGIERQGFLVLPFAMEHAVEIKSLPRIHADPFDRALIAQAREPA